jgi:hypothetical protein
MDIFSCFGMWNSYLNFLPPSCYTLYSTDRKEHSVFRKIKKRLKPSNYRTDPVKLPNNQLISYCQTGIAQLVKCLARGGKTGHRFQADAGILLLVNTSGAHQTSYQKFIPPGIKRPECERHHVSPPNTDVKNAWLYTSTSPKRLNGEVLGHRGH